MSISESAKLERKIYLYRAYIAQGKYNIVITEIKDTDPIDLKAVKILAVYLQSKSGGQASDTKKEEALKELKEVILNDVTNTLNSTVQIVAGSIYYHEGLFEDALKILSRHNKNLEW